MSSGGAGKPISESHGMNRPHPGEWRDVLERYQRCRLERAAAVRRLGRRWSGLSYLRGGLFFLTLGLAYSSYQEILAAPLLAWSIAALSAAGFLTVVAWHDRVERGLERARACVEFYDIGMARSVRDWRCVPIPRIEPSDGFRPVALDLDVFGSASLAQLLSSVRTAVGLPMLANWLQSPARPEEIRLRQQAVRVLADDIAWRERFQLDCQVVSGSPVGSEKFLQWADSPSWLERRPFLVWFARLSAALMAASFTCFFTGWVPAQIVGVAALILLAVNFLTTVFVSAKVHEIFENISSRREEVRQYESLFSQLAEVAPLSTRLRELARDVGSGPRSARSGMRGLARVVWFGNLRRHGILFPLYLFLQFFSLWDIHSLRWLERWKARYRDNVPDWFAALAQVEVLASLATLAHEHPDWAFPQVGEEGVPGMTATGLGHPLLPNDTRVCNDVSLGPPGTVLIVTGSNMSGKSTFLRSVGLNVILAQMGSVVCARSLALHPVVLETSMRIDDSLAAGVSFFMAELKRLKQIVDRCGQARAGGSQFLFLLDEILQGTNSRERHIAVEAVIRQLLGLAAFGSFTTHDLELAKDDGLGKLARTVYFTESFEQTPLGDEMKFDYIMRPGVAPTTNALKLLRIVGLDPRPEAN
jgi:hypothetical protein